MQSAVKQNDERAWNAAKITQTSQQANKPGIADALEILKYLAGMSSLVK